MKNLIYSMIDNAIIKNRCLICQDDIYIDDKYYLFCCGQYYHEKCLAEYIGLNMYAKCPICHKWITKEIKEVFDIIFDKEYKLDYMREKIRGTKTFTQDQSFYNEMSTSPPQQSRRRNALTPDEILPLIPRLELPPISRTIPSPPRAPRNLRSNTSQRFANMFNIIDEYGERQILEDDMELPFNILLDRLSRRHY